MKHLFSKLLMPVIAITVVSCSNDEWIEVQHGSLQDAEYSGKNLEVYLKANRPTLRLLSLTVNRIWKRQPLNAPTHL